MGNALVYEGLPLGTCRVDRLFPRSQSTYAHGCHSYASNEKYSSTQTALTRPYAGTLAFAAG